MQYDPAKRLGNVSCIGSANHPTRRKLALCKAVDTLLLSSMGNSSILSFLFFRSFLGFSPLLQFFVNNPRKDIFNLVKLRIDWG